MKALYRNIILLCLSLTAALSCSMLQRQTLSLVQYNVGAFGKYPDSGTGITAALIREMDADFVSLNETDSCNRRHPQFQCRELADSLGKEWGAHFSRAIPFAGGAYGNGIVTRKEILAAETLPLPRLDGSEARCAAIVETAEAVFVSVHLDYADPPSATAQASLLSEALSSRYAHAQKPVFLAGDMNALPGSPVLQVLEKDWKILSPQEPTYPCPDAEKCIDYILLLKNGVRLRSVTSRVFREDPRVEAASDHYPLLVVVSF